ncbi:MAG: Fic family protein [archaeon]|nr:Fic family protein [archaeon]
MMKSLIDAHILERICEKKKRLDSIRPLSKAALQRLKERFCVEWTYNSNAIEGNTLTLNETRLVLERGLTAGGKTLREHFEAVNHMEAIGYVESMVKSKEQVSEDMIKKMHAIVMKGINDDEAGVYRTARVRILGAVFTPPDPVKIERLMPELVRWINTEKVHPVELSALAHYKLVHVHPFGDGNGRTSRLLMNVVLMRCGFPPAIVLNVERKKYYDRLKKADQGNVKLFVNFIARCAEQSLDLYLEALEPVKEGEDKELVSLSEAARGTPYGQEYLSLLARRGKLGAVKISRNWMISKDDMRKYIVKVKKE